MSLDLAASAFSKKTLLWRREVYDKRVLELQSLVSAPAKVLFNARKFETRIPVDIQSFAISREAIAMRSR